jgi:transformation/transcription domain-associated protein
MVLVYSIEDENPIGMTSKANISDQRTHNYLDFYLIIDAIWNVLTNDDMDFWQIIQRQLIIIIEICETVCDDNNFNHLPLFDYLAEKVCQLCYERSWYAKKAG